MISLVTATLGRVEDISVLCGSLARQTYKNFEFIIVDQNDHFKVQEIIENFKDKFKIKYIRSEVRGLSYNRNIGLRQCEGDIVGFPDDDCFYSDDVLEQVSKTLLSRKNSFALLSAFDPLTTNNFIKPIKFVRRVEIMKYAISYNVFLNLDTSIFFDERLGVGTFFSSGEETDYLWQILSTRDRGIFANKAKVFHPENKTDISCSRAYSYGLGFGALFKKEVILRKNYQYFFIYIKYLFRSIGGILLSSNKVVYWNTLKGRVKGFLLFKV